MIPTSANYKHYLTSQEFTQRFTNATDRATLDNYLKGQGFTVTDSGLGVLVNATASVAQVQKTFGITISDYQDKRTGRIFYRNDNTASLPSAVAPLVTNIDGLSNSSQFYPRTVKLAPDKVQQPKTNGTPTGCAAAVSVANASDSFHT